MKIISSQHFIDWGIVERKMEELENEEEVVIPCVYAGVIDGEEYAVQIDGHHTLAAARELELNVEFEIKDNDTCLEGDDYLNSVYMDGDWYDVQASDPVSYKFKLVW